MFNLLHRPFNFGCKRRDLLCNHSNRDLFTREDNMLFSRLKMAIDQTRNMAHTGTSISYNNYEENMCKIKF